LLSQMNRELCSAYHMPGAKASSLAGNDT
jgi:hypothetical protein